MTNLTTTLTDPPLTSAEVLAILADARTWPCCLECGRPKPTTDLGDDTEETP